MKLYRLSMLVMMIITAILAVLTTIQTLSGLQNLFGAFVAFLLFCYCVVQIICLFTRKLSKRNIGFHVLHTGIVLFLIGVFIYELVGFSIPYNSIDISKTQMYSTIANENREFVDLGFNVGFTNFAKTTYDPIYDLYEMNSNGKFDKKIHDVSPDEDGVLNFGEYGQLKESSLESLENRDNQYTWRENIIIYLRQPDKYYEADVILSELGRSDVQNVKLAVNKPLRKNGWIIYLMNYNPDMTGISVLFKYDPGELISQIGIWMIIIGTFIMCLFKSKRGGEANE